ncbi:hypothetical protein [Brevibacillus sp. SAFN-007a]|uniref:hypothetical protein n=1 Tax=Brevibacillus sp. SAFN-007a TaxID=3436862 RepID=UPI003F7F1561
MKRVATITFMLSLILSGCAGGTAMVSSEQSTTQQANEQTQTSNFKIHPELFKDRDALLEVAQKTNDYATIEFKPEQIQQLKNDEQYKDYKKVLKKFVADQLKSEVVTFQTISSHGHSRMILVTTKDEKVYKICMKQTDSVWLAECYAEIEWVTYPVN